MKKHIGCGCGVIIKNDNMILLGKRGKDIEKADSEMHEEGTWTLPGGNIEYGETFYEAGKREVKEETGLDAIEVNYQFSIPNLYLYSGFMVHTLDMFYIVRVKDLSHIEAMDDAAAYYWIPLKDIQIEKFAFESIKKGLLRFLKTQNIQ